jgi:alpha-glucosidase
LIPLYLSSKQANRKVKQVQQVESNKFNVYLQGGYTIVLTCLNSEIWKVLVVNNNSKYTERGSWAVESSVEQSFPLVNVEQKIMNDCVVLVPAIVDNNKKCISVTIDTAKFRLEFSDATTGRVFQSNWSFNIGAGSLQSDISFSYNKQEQILGLGEKAGVHLNKKGTKYVMWNYDHFGYTEKGDPLYQSIPFALFAEPPNNDNKDKQLFHSVFVDNAGRQEWDLTNDGTLSVYSGADPCRIYISLSDNIAGLVHNYTTLTGTSPLPPLYGLGYHQCRWSYETDSKVREIATSLRDKDIPCDVVYLDIDYMSRFRCFTWSQTNFPDPKGLLQWLKELNYRVVVIIDPGIKIEKDYDVYESGLQNDHFVKRLNPKTNALENYVNNCWAESSLFPDFTKQETRQWWGQLYKGLVEDGVSGFWNDMNEPACFNTQQGKEKKTFHSDVIHNCDNEPTTHEHCHNIYGMQMARGTFEGLSKIQSNERPLVVTRSGYAGVQRYAWTWTGDNTSNFNHLALSVPMMLNMGMTGQPFTGADIGGFCGNCNPELYARWISFAAIAYPFCRSHSIKDSLPQEPYSFGEDVEEISRKYIKLRYRLMPYLYTWARHSSKTGQPMLRSLIYEYPNVLPSYESRFADTQLFVGPDLMVCPVLKENQTRRSLYLPPGTWYSFYDKKEYVGNQIIVVDAPLDTVPLFVRENAIIPMRATSRNTVYENLEEPLVFEFFGSDTDGTGTITHPSYVYLDDGISRNYETSEEYGLYQIMNAKTGNLKLIEGKGYQQH